MANGETDENYGNEILTRVNITTAVPIHIFNYSTCRRGGGGSAPLFEHKNYENNYMHYYE